MEADRPAECEAAMFRTSFISSLRRGEKHLKLNSLLVKLDESNVELLGEVVEAPVTPELYNRLVQMSERF